jgi:hypothetical protein
MDVESKETIAASLELAKTSLLEVETKLVGDIIVLSNSSILQLNNIIKGVLLGFQTTVDSLMSQLNTSINSFDGWTLEVVIPPISIKLSKPK